MLDVGISPGCVTHSFFTRSCSSTISHRRHFLPYMNPETKMSRISGGVQDLEEEWTGPDGDGKSEEEAVGAVQVLGGKGDDGRVRDLGWNGEGRDVPDPLVGGLSNEELWVLVRRFNKVGLFILFFCVMVEEEDVGDEGVRRRV